MKKVFQKVMFVLLFSTACITVEAQEPAPRKGIVRVKVHPQVALQLGTQPRTHENGVLKTGIAPFDLTAGKVKAKSIKRAFPYAPNFEAQMAKAGLDRWYEVEFDESIAPQEAASLFRRTAGVQAANPKVPMVLLEGEKGFRKAMPVAPARDSEMPFDDPRLSAQWHYNNDGSIAGSKAGADINLFEAWKTTTGSNDVLVAIIDGGVDVNHEDLKANMYVNQKELNGKEGFDDDGNGYIDDIHGYNFCTGSAEIYPHPHGTHVAGTVGAVNGNGIGVSGVAGGDGTAGSGVKMISCQVFDSRSGSGEGDFASAIVYAAHSGASIAQCSWGWSSPEYKEQDVLDAIDYFIINARSQKLGGGVMFFATGNNGDTGNYYPAAYDKVVAVGSMTSDYTSASYSNYGSWVDVVAPGGLLDYGEQGGVLSTLPGDTYGFNEGTSMATPHVSGIAALVLSKYGKPDMPAETLRQQILSSVNDFYAHNPGLEGLHGAGYVDAAKALLMGDGTAPQAVDAFTALPAQDNVTLEWVIPASSDNNVNHHIIYYSTEPFTAESNLSNIPQVVADTKFMSSGEKFTYELTGLAPTTTYYIALKAVNRWGDSSPLSPVITATTNAGPQMTIDETSLALNVDATQAVASATFHIGNQDEGLLKWNGYVRTTQSNISTNANRPVAGLKGKLKSRLGVMPMARGEVYQTADFQASDYPKEFRYFVDYFANIGESDKSLPNSMAQWFYVDKEVYPDGFNLTGFRITSNKGKDPTFQILRGNNLSNATLVEEIKPSMFYKDMLVRLTEQCFFAPGESFWVVAHFPGGQEDYPLGMATADDEKYGAYSYMSNDLGQTWLKLADALKGSQYEDMGGKAVWAVTALSQNPDWGSMMVMTPSQGTVRKGETQEVTLTNDGQPMCNGTYKFNLRFVTNESEANALKLPVTLTVKDQKPRMVTAKVVNFGDILVGEEKTLSVEVVNEGYGNFGKYGSLSSNSIVCRSEHFKAPTYIQDGFPARAKQQFDVTYCPKTAGSHTATITFTHADGTTFSVTVRGVATDPAEIAVTPDTVNVGVLDVDVPTHTTREFTITNNGNYPLEFLLPKFSDKKLEAQTQAAHRFGYTTASNLGGENGFAHDGNQALIGGTDITKIFSDDVYLSGDIALGFKFPFYGKEYDRVYISSYGGLAFNKSEAAYRSPLTETCYSLEGIAYISAYGTQLAMAPDSKIEYAKQDGKFVVKYTNVMALVYDQDYKPVSFRIVLSANGDIEMFYDDYNGEELFQEGSSLYCGLHDPENADQFTVTSAEVANYFGTNDTPEGNRYKLFTDNTAVKFVAPKPNFISSITPAYGIVNPGESATLTAEIVAGDNLIAGKTFNRVTLLSNDPKNSTVYVHFDAEVVGESLKPVAELEQTTVDFGRVFRTALAQMPVTVKNNGRDSLTISSATLAHGRLTMKAELPCRVAPGMSKDIILTLPTETEGSVEDEITIVTNAGELKAAVKAQVIGVPTMDLSYQAIRETVESGTPIAKPLTITNNGNETLVYAITPNPLVALSETVDETSVINYSYSATTDGNGVPYEWIDIETNGKGEHNNFSYYNSHDFVEVQLPFEFPFYGKKYSTMYIYNTGFVSFTKREDQKIWPEPPADFPAGTIYTNMIAPYWGLHTMDMSKTAGTYHFLTEDQAVVSFMEYGNTMNMGVCFQVILRKDGTFKYQYKGFGDYAMIFAPFGLAGVSNEDASRGFKIPERYIAFGNAVEFKPIVEQTVAPGENRTVEVNVLTDKMAGQYTGNIEISTNVPHSEKVLIPVDLTVTGEAKPVFPDTIVVENIKGSADPAYQGPITAMGAFYEAYFKIENRGTATFTINNIMNEGVFEYEDPWFGETVQQPAMTWYNGPELDMFTGEPTGNKIWQQYWGDTPVEVDNKGLEISIPVMQGTIEGIPGVYDIPMTFTYNETETAEVVVRFIVNEAPYLTTDKSEIRVNNATETYKDVDSVVISNEGKFKLVYDLRVDPSGQGEAVEENPGQGGIMPTVKTKRTAAPVAFSTEQIEALTNMLQVSMDFHATSDNVLDVPKDFQFTNAMFHPTLVGSNITYNYGAGNKYGVYKAATLYQAPEEGFNISHIYIATTMTNGDGSVLENADIHVEIVNGNDYESEDVLGTGSVHFEHLQGASFVVIPLKRAVYINPGQEFYVRVTYPAGVEFPAYMSQKNDGVESNRYMGFVEGYGWFDIASMFKDQYGSIGYIMSCLETQPGDAWVKLLNEKTSGELQPGESVTVKVQLDASFAPKEKENKAMLVIKSNDVYNPVYNFPIYLSKNGAPVIEGPQEIAYINEGDTAAIRVAVTEPEGDDMTIALKSDSAMVRIVGATAEDAAANVTVNANGTVSVKNTKEKVYVSVQVTPDYDQAGNHTLEMEAADSAGHISTAAIRYYVENVNRAPMAQQMDTLSVELGQSSSVVDMETLFADPDGDEMTYTFTVSDNEKVSVFQNGNNLIFVGKAVGNTVVSVVATDAQGAQTSNTFVVNVTVPSGIGGIDVSAEVNVYPNPVMETLYVRLAHDCSSVTYALYDINGKRVYLHTADAVAGTEHAISVAHLPQGVYLLKVAANDGTAVHRILKK